MATTVHQGTIKYLAGYYWRGEWTECELKLLSDATLQVSYSGEKTVLDTKLLSVAVPMSSVANSFVIKTLEGEQENYSTGPMFSAASEEECRKWIMSINETIVQQKIATRHQHPLPSNGAPTDHAPPTCAICEQAHPYLYYHTCEYCENYQICSNCYRRNTHLPRYPKVKSVSHPHQLYQSGLLRGSSTSDPQCSRCNANCKGTYYMCPDCPIPYFECSTCAYILVNNETSPKSTEMKLNIGNLDHVIEHDVSTQAYKLLVHGKRCPDSMSIISQQPWDLSRIETEPVPHAYFEVTFKSFSENVAVGIGNQLFAQNRMLGQQKNSYGYLSDGSFWVSEKSKSNECESIQPGDTIGAGILLDSYNLRRLYFTKNGNILGFFPGRVHKGMDCFPGISFHKYSAAEFSANMTGPFKFDTNSIPNYRNNKVDRLQTIPKEVIASILSYSTYSRPSHTNHTFALQLQLVSKSFKAAALDNEVWRTLFLRYWDTAYAGAKIKSWMAKFKERLLVSRSEMIGSHPIENCDFEFQCPVMWEKLNTTSNEAERFCDKCQKTVYEVSDTETLDKYARMGRCVSFIVRLNDEDHFNYDEGRLGGEAPEPERNIPSMFDPEHYLNF